jgi:3-phenylpropionate/trans-cinnamate dioxygenase ferredoxin component
VLIEFFAPARRAKVRARVVRPADSIAVSGNEQEGELTSDAFRTIALSDAIPNDFVVPFYLDDRKLRISVARVDDCFYAFDDLCTCTGAGCPLSGGLLTGTTIMCQCHGSRFDLTTGGVINGPATDRTPRPRGGCGAVAAGSLPLAHCSLRRHARAVAHCAAIAPGNSLEPIP